ncbi:MAG: hypothetical protein ABEJ88_02120 [Halobacterium sp.]
MSADAKSRTNRDEGEAQRLQSVLAVSGLTVALGVTVPLYYGLIELVPLAASLVLESVVLGALTVALFVAFPAMFAYADRLDVSQDADVPEYGVNDRWEREHL